nr:MAG TPA: hypothetical protein [Bacteriophage sp.]
MPDCSKQEESPGVCASWAFVLYHLDTCYPFAYWHYSICR